MLREGMWGYKSKSDPRWNIQGEGLVGLFSQSKEAVTALEEKKKELNEEPPDDLRFWYEKY